MMPLFCLACRTAPSAGDASVEPVQTSLPATVTPSPTATVRPTETPRPSPTAIRARMVVEDQVMREDGLLQVDEVVLTDPAWVVVFNDMGEVIGETAVSFGVVADLEIEIDLAQASEQLRLEIFQASGNSTSFDPQINAPLSPPISQEIDITLEITVPELTISQLDLSLTGVLTVDSVLASESGWVVVHTLDDDEAGELVGIVHVEAGLTRHVQVPLRWREASQNLLVTLLVDNGRIHAYEPSLDTAVVVAQQRIEQPIAVTLPIDILVYDQPLTDGFITIDRIIAPDDGWVAVYQDEGGESGLIIGYAPIKAGVNQQVPVDVIDSAVTDPMHVLLHEDTHPNDDIDLPLNDQPFTVDGQAVEPVSFSISPNPYFVVKNQPLTAVLDESGIEIELLFVTFQSWVLVHEMGDEEEVVGALLGQTAVSAGISRNLFVPLPAEVAGQTVIVSLYLNSGDPALLEIEEEIDIPLRIDQQEIRVPLTILERSE